MNDTTGTDSGGLKGSFGSKGTKVNQIPYGHPHAEKLLDEARSVISESALGAPLFKVLDTHKIPVHVIKGVGESGFSPDLMTIYLQVAGKTDALNGSFLINLIKALREAAQELGGFKTPDPRKDLIKYAEFIHSRNMESVVYTCKVINELTNSSHYADLLDSLAKLGLNGLYKAVISGGSKDDLFIEYAKAYNSTTN